MAYVNRNIKGHVLCYLAGDGKTVQTFHGDVIGEVTRSTVVRCARSWVHGTTMRAVQVRLSSDNRLYYGRGNRNLALTLRPYKQQGV